MMYFEKIELENIGPIDHLDLNLYDGNSNPKPIIIVGENGTGKSILLSHFANFMMVAKQEIFEDLEVEKGKAYKYRSPLYIKSGKNFSFASVKYSSGLSIIEWQLPCSKNDFESNFNYTPIKSEWNQIQPDANSHFNSNFSSNKQAVEKITKTQCNLYFPVNRFEDPAWLNLDNLTKPTKYTELKNVAGYSNRHIICTSPLKENKNWLLDLMFDRQVFESKFQEFPIQIQPNTPAIPLQIFTGFNGQTTTIYEAVIKILKVILREPGNIRLGAGNRKSRQISVIKDEKQWVPNLFQLSTGETQLLNLFLSILRDYDLSGGEFKNISDVKGVVIIDEIDAHLHTAHQKEILPELIASFPMVQFIITTHSPLFLMGMKEKFGDDGFNIIDMPGAQKIDASDFSEYVAAYNAFKNTEKFRDEIRAELILISKPIIFVEGDYDIRYINKAATLLKKENILERFEIKDGDGFGNLDKIWRSYSNSTSKIIPGKILLLYDCDTNKQNSDNNKIYKRVIQTIIGNPILIGIENLFPTETIEKIEEHNPQFIDINPSVTKRVRGQDVILPPSKSANKDEKGNLCNWLCDHGDANDFRYFCNLFSLMEEILELQ